MRSGDARYTHPQSKKTHKKEKQQMYAFSLFFGVSGFIRRVCTAVYHVESYLQNSAGAHTQQMALYLISLLQVYSAHVFLAGGGK